MPSELGLPLRVHSFGGVRKIGPRSLPGWCSTLSSAYQPAMAEPPRVAPGSFLTLHYRLSGPDGRAVVDTFEDKPATLSLGAGQLAPAIETHLLGLPEGCEASFELPAGAAFGQRNPQLLQRVKRALLEELGEPEAEYAVGDVVEFPTPDGQGRYAGVVRECAPEWLLFDFNHPLAGQAVRFDVRLLGVM